jgi:hypothetical protein
MSSREGHRARLSATDVALALDAAFASERRAFGGYGTVPHAHGCGASILFARAPRSESYLTHGVRLEWEDATHAPGDVHGCTHGGHTPTHTHGAPVLPRWFRHTLDAVLALTLAPYDASASRSTIAECAAALTPGYRVRRDPVEWSRERVEHERKCSDCKRARFGVTPTNTYRPEPLSAMLSDTTRLAMEHLHTPTNGAQRRAHAAQRRAWFRRLDARLAARDA